MLAQQAASSPCIILNSFGYHMSLLFRCSMTVPKVFVHDCRFRMTRPAVLQVSHFRNCNPQASLLFFPFPVLPKRIYIPSSASSYHKGGAAQKRKKKALLRCFFSLNVFPLNSKVWAGFSSADRQQPQPSR